MATRQFKTASGLPLLLFMVLCLQGTEGFINQVVVGNDTSAQPITVPSDGVYLVTMVTDHHALNLHINGQSSNFTALASSDIAVGLTVAVPLKAGDKLSADPNGPCNADVHCRLGVALVSSNKNNYKTLKSINVGGLIVRPFPWTYNQNGMWRPYQGTAWISVILSGMYWISVRPQSATEGFTAVVKTIDPSVFVYKEFFRTYLRKANIALSASAAFYIKGGNRVIMRINEWERVSRNATMLSLVRLDSNKAATFGGRFEHVAYTGLVDFTGNARWNETIGFGKSKTDYGGMYSICERRWTIPVSGVYIVSLRGDPVGEASIALRLLHNDRQIFTAFAEHGQPSGQDAVFSFQKDDVLEIKPVHHDDDDDPDKDGHDDGDPNEVNIGLNTMMSIAFVASQ